MRKFLILFFLMIPLNACFWFTTDQKPFETDKKFSEANEMLSDKLYEDARKTFEEVKRHDTEQSYAPLAQLRIADSYVAEGEPELAIGEYKEFMSSYPKHKYASYAQYKIAMIYFDKINGPDRGFGAAKKALEEFERLNSVYPRNPYRETAILKIASARETIAEHEFGVGEFYYNKKSWNAALDRFLGLLRDFPSYKREHEVLYRIALLYKILANDAEAKNYLDMLAAKYPESKLVEDARRRFAEIEKDRK